MERVTPRPAQQPWPRYLPALSVERHRVTTSDGVELAAESVGSGPAVLIASGIGVASPGLGLLISALAEHYRVITWDYRGIGLSAVGRATRDFSMPRHGRDGLEVLSALGVSSAVVLGWSMGVPVGLEMIRLGPGQVAGYGALFGAANHPFRHGFPKPASFAFETVFRVARRIPRPAQTLLDVSMAWPRFPWTLATAVGFCGTHAHRASFRAHVNSTARADKRAYFLTMNEVLHHDSRDVLSTIRVPALVVAGTRDWATPPRAAKKIADAIPGCRYILMNHTTHFGPIEVGEDLWRPIRELVDKAHQTKAAS